MSIYLDSLPSGCMRFFKELTDAQVLEFEQSARDTYAAGDPIERDIWHPAYVAECDRINNKALE